MRPAYPDFIRLLGRTDPALFDVVARECDLVMGPGELEPQTKLLILLAVDAFAGSTGVAPIAAAARRQGASETQIAEALRIAAHVAANRVRATAAAAFGPAVTPA